MSDLLFYVILSTILFEVLLIFFKTYLDKKEKTKFSADRILLTSTSVFDIMLIPVIAYIIGYFFSAFFKFHSDFLAWAVTTAVAGVITLVLAFWNFKWIHFTSNKIILRRPLAKQTRTIDIKNIRSAGFVRRYKNPHYYIVAKQGRKIKPIPLHAVQAEDGERIANYFVSRGIKYISS